MTPGAPSRRTVIVMPPHRVHALAAASIGHASRSHFSRAVVAAHGIDPSGFRSGNTNGVLAWDGPRMEGPLRKPKGGRGT